MIILVNLPYRIPLVILLLLVHSRHALGSEVLTRIGDDVTLKCDNDRGQTVSWVKSDFQIVSYRGTIDVTEYPRYEVQGENRMLIRNVEKGDNMMFHCRYKQSYLGNVSVVVVVNPVKVEIKNIGQLNEHDDVTLVCEANGVNPKPKVKWSIDGKSYSETSSHFVPFKTMNSRLSLKRMSRDLDRRRVRCQVTTRTIPGIPTISVQTSQITLLVKHPPSIPLISKSTKELKAGETVTLTCTSFDGRPLPTLKWISSQGKPLDTLSSPKNGSLQVLKTEVELLPTHNGVVFTCMCETEAENVQNSIVLDVKFSPIIKETIFNSKEPPIYIQGDKLEMHCTSEANPSSVTYKWYKENSQLILGSGSTYVKTALEINDGLDFICVASNSIGSSEKIFRIKLHYPPRLTIIDNKRNKIHNESLYTVRESDTLDFQCHVDALPQIQKSWWTRDGNEISDEPRLKITSMSQRQLGRYACHATNLMSRSQSNDGSEHVTRGRAISIVDVIVQYKPGKSSIELLNQPIKSKSFSMKCSTDNRGEPLAEYEWLNVTSKGQKVIHRGEIYHVGVAYYNMNVSCRAVNVVGNGELATKNIVLKEFVRFIDLPMKTTLRHNLTASGNNLVLNCSARGVETPIIRWSRLGSALPAAATIRNEVRSSYSVFSSLEFKDITMNDGGQYRCHVNNSISESDLQRNYDLQLQYAPNMEMTERKVATAISDSSELICSVRSNPAVTFKWSITGGSKIDMSNKVIESTIHIEPDIYTSKLLFERVEEHDLTDYICKATNAIGFREVVIELGPPSTPDPPTSMYVIKSTWENVELVWTPGFHGGYRQHYEISGGQGQYATDILMNSYNFEGLYPNKNYNFTIKSVNLLGASEELMIEHKTKDFKIATMTKSLFDRESNLLTIEYDEGDINDEEFCVRVKYFVISDAPRWKLIYTCFVKNSSEVLLTKENRIQTVLVSMCLKRRRDICGQEIDATRSAFYMGEQEDLPSSVIIIVGSVCGSIVLILTVILIVLCCRRHKARKAYEAETANHQSPVMTQQHNTGQKSPQDIPMYTPPVYGGSTISSDKPDSAMDYRNNSYGDPIKTKKVMYEVVV